MTITKLHAKWFYNRVSVANSSPQQANGTCLRNPFDVYGSEKRSLVVGLWALVWSSWANALIYQSKDDTRDSWLYCIATRSKDATNTL